MKVVKIDGCNNDIEHRTECICDHHKQIPPSKPCNTVQPNHHGIHADLRFVLALQVQNPTDEQKQQTKWKAGKVIVVYFGTMEMESVSLKKVQPWDAMQAPSAATGSLGMAVAQALNSMNAEATA